VDPVEDDANAYQAKLQKALDLYESQLAARRTLPSVSLKLGLKGALKQICRKLKYRNYRLSNINAQQEQLCTSIADSTTAHCSQLACPDANCIEHLAVDYFNDYVDVDFEGFRFKAIRQWDAYLSKLYGDYMQLPPEEDRCQHSCDHTLFYWKAK
jgi:lipopolysaccharide cholinephosphotransferase